MRKPKTLLDRAIDRVRGRNGWWFYHFVEDHIASPYKRVPLRQAMMADARRVMYLPIAKNACSSLKTLVAELGGMHIGSEDDIHALLDAGPNDLVLLHRSEADINAMLADPSWMRFAVLREPMDRLVSLYVEKFVQHRTHPGVRITIDPVLIRTLDKDKLTEADYEKGITFRAFAEDLLSEPPERLDPHWRPQSLYLNDICYTHLFTIKTLDVLKKDMQAHLGAEVELPHKNAVRASERIKTQRQNVADNLPAEIEAADKINVDQFMDAYLRARLTAYFALDMSLYALVRQMNEQLATGDMRAVATPS